MPKRLLALLFAVPLLGLGACSDDGDDGDDKATGPTCSYESDGMDPAKQAEAPPAEPTETGKVDVTVATSFGDVKAVLDAEKTPCTVNSFLSLAEQDYFDATQCHRLTTQGIYVLQCGDPSGTGMGGPGYQFADELDGTETYGAGTLAMANAGPDTNGSQFFMVYEDSQLPPSYTVFGQVDTASIKLLQKVAAKGTQTGTPDGPPKEQVTIDEVA
jgi:peptidyl-prolyl cis-trans isomerase B (cyclophilin B)